MGFSRRQVLHAGLGATLAGTLPHAVLAKPKRNGGNAPASDVAEAGAGAFDAGTVRRLAQALARHPYAEPDGRLPAAVNAMSFDQYRGVRFRKEFALWRGQNLPFQVEFLPRGFLYRPRIDMFEVASGRSAPLGYSPDLFDYEDPKLKVPDPLGFAGFRLHYPLNRPDYFDEVCVFLGASYFRAVARGQEYGLSARGFANRTGNAAKGEEFALFRAFWLEKPLPDADAMVVHALLDGPTTTGAYRFAIRPGDETVFDVECTVYPRQTLVEPGIAPLTGMFFFDTNDRSRVDDARPAAHDSEGLSIWNGGGEQIWRPLANPVDLQFSAFTDSRPKGFGLMQRKRAFADYQDLALDYQKRPSLWI
ncbi:MAG: glucan biosynthesis protein, partial [Gluconacetobacter diazotrophicus]|nr:glucan biosynthesis protein [Gluconacetobacter diazotrophicus]